MYRGTPQGKRHKLKTSRAGHDPCGSHQYICPGKTMANTRISSALGLLPYTISDILCASVKGRLKARSMRA